MRKAILLATTILAMNTANAGMWEKISTLNEKTIKPTAVYNVETAGWNIRVVEWTPAGNPNVRCVFGGGSKKGGISCYQKQ